MAILPPLPVPQPKPLTPEGIAENLETLYSGPSGVAQYGPYFFLNFFYEQ
jgi:hypothetical protein